MALTTRMGINVATSAGPIRRIASCSTGAAMARRLAKSRCRCGWGEPCPGANVAGVSPSPGADVAG
jgi:hypothetical protein